jgi:alkaline phosphatase D
MKHFLSPFAGSARLTALLVLLGISSYHSLAEAQLTHGPILGHLTSQQATIWARAKNPGTYTLRVIGPNNTMTSEADAETANDLCLKWTVSNLKPGTRYSYIIQQGSRVLSRGDQYRFTTVSPGGPSTLRLAFGSCADEDEGSAAVWRRIQTLDPQAVILLGDTPYIDSVDLKILRKRHGEFLGFAALQNLVAGRSLYATWDDHDFGRNDTNGNLPGKENSRQAFVEYHANPSYGDGKQGIYTKFRRGNVEVFLLDTRFFAATEMSPIAPGKPTLLGKQQWHWLLDGLKQSQADFKLLACGMVWNKAVRPGKQDQWGTYAHEREALFRFIGNESISGVVLVSGDVHRTRVISHLSVKTAGYRIPELTTSPVHSSVIDNSNQPHPGLVFDSGTGNTFLLLTSSQRGAQAKLNARFITKDGKTFFQQTYLARSLQKR